MWERDKSESWKGMDGWSGRRLRWFRDRMAVLVSEMLPAQNGFTDDDRLEVLLALLETPERYARKAPEEEYRGRGYGAWAWRIDDKLVLEEVKRLVDERQNGRELSARTREDDRQRTQEAEQYPTLDEWLEAERRKGLWAPMIPERHGVHLLDAVKSPHAGAFWRAADDRNLQWPRACRQCGGKFTWAAVGRRNVVRCGDCLPKRGRRGPRKED